MLKYQNKLKLNWKNINIATLKYWNHLDYEYEHDFTKMTQRLKIFHWEC